MQNRLTSGIRNISAGLINKVLIIILAFIIRTVMLYSLGSEYLGLNGLFTSVLSVLNMAELGVGSALVFTMYKPAAENDISKLAALLSVYKRIYILIGLFVFIIGILLLPFMPYLIKGSCPDDINIYVLYFIYLINTVISYLFFAYKKALLIAYQRNDIISLTNSIVLIILYVIQAVILLGFRSYYWYVIFLPIMTLVENALCAIVVGHLYPGINCEGDISKQEKKEILKHVKAIALQKICSASRNSFDSIVVSMYIGLTTIAMYNNYFYIMNSVHIFLYQIPDSIRSTVGNSVSIESIEKNYKDFETMTYIYTWLNSICTICLFCLFQPFMILWAGEDMIFPVHTMAMFCIYSFAISLGDMCALYKDAAGLWWHGRFRTILEAILNLLLNFVLGYFWGVDGILMATILTVVFMGLGYGGYIVFHYYFRGKKYINYIFLQIKCCCATIVATTITYNFCNMSNTQGIISLIIRLVICLVIGVPILWLFYRIMDIELYQDARIFVMNIISNMKKTEGKK
jgi:O-antigen/teichoic acid export membrane protein